MSNSYTNSEYAVGAFLITGLAVALGLTFSLGEINLFSHDEYRLRAAFVSSSGLKEGASVELGGVRIGSVTKIELDPDSYLSYVEFSLPTKVIVQEDAIASVRTSGIIGDKFLKLTPGGSETLLRDGDILYETESSISLEELVSKYIFEATDD